MPAGRRERGPARAVLSTPAHPYTRCLQLANPSLRAERRALYVMPEQMPSLRQLQHMIRLPLRAALSSGRPTSAAALSRPSVEIATDHFVACIRADSAAGIEPHTRTSGTRNDGRAGASCEVETLSKIYRTSQRAVRRRVRSLRSKKRPSASSRTNLSPSSARAAAARAPSPRCWSDWNRRRRAHRLNGEDMTDAAPRERARHADKLQMVFQDPQSALNPRRRVASIVTQAMEAGSRHASWDERRGAPRRCWPRSGFEPISPRGCPANCRAASASASTLRARFARCRRY